MKTWAIGIVAAMTLATAAPSFAQGIQIGPDGVRIIEQDRREERRDDRRDERRDERRSRDIGERDAVRIARAEGVREVDTVRRGDRSYRVVGTDRRGDDIQVDIDRRNGDVLSVR